MSGGMRRPEPDSPDAQRRAQTAAAWLVRRDRGLTAAEQDEFHAWLAEDPRHGEWFALHRRTVGDYSALLEWRPEHSETPNPDLLAPPRRRKRWIAPAALATAAAVAFSIAWIRHSPREEVQTPSPTPPVGLERRILEDGSSVELNHGAVVTVEFTRTNRRAVLLGGEALFSVEKDPNRPFIVRAAGVDVRAVGTIFTVRLDAAAVEVLVTEGKVAVAEANATPRVAAAEETGLTAGQRATIPLAHPASPTIVSVTPAQMAQQLSWQPQLLDFASAPLSAAVAEFNRRNRVQFTIADAEIAAMPIVASIRSDRIETFIAFLASTPSIEVERRTELEVILRRRR
jgi:transmembrane sensor